MAGAPRLLPAEVVVTEWPAGLIRIDNLEQNDDHVTLTNFGDRPTVITVEQQADFVTIEPMRFTILPGRSRSITIRSLPRPPGIYYGHITFHGDGTSDGVYAFLMLLSLEKPGGIN